MVGMGRVETRVPRRLKALLVLYSLLSRPRDLSTMVRKAEIVVRATPYHLRPKSL